MLRLRTFGAPFVERDGEAMEGAARQRRVIALLTILADAGIRGASRDRVLSLLWSESEPEKGRQALTQALYHTRRTLGADDLVRATADLSLNPSVLSSDLGDFQDALARGDWREAAELYTGPFLDGFFVTGAPEFERWASERRVDLQRNYVDALEKLAADAERLGNTSDLLAWCKRLVTAEPLNARYALGYMRALAAVGDRAAAIRHAHVHEMLLRDELNAAPNPTIAAYAEELRQAVPPSPTHGVPAGVELTARDTPDDSHVAPVVPKIVRHWRWRRAAPWLAGAFAVVLVIASTLWMRHSQTRVPSRDVLVVVPFRVTGADRALAYLREGLVDLLVAKLSEADTTQVVDPGAMMSAWRRAGLGDRRDVSRDEALEVARGLGGDRVLVGSLVGTPARMVISASLIATATGKLRAQATAEAPSDSVTVAVDRLVARLLATEAGEGDRLANHTTLSSLALRAYLDGQSLRRRGRYREALVRFQHALASDRSFALAALALTVVAERLGNDDERERALAVAWASRHELSDRDSTFLAALAGPQYPAPSTPRERFAAWERAASVAADRAEIWQALGETLFHDGAMLGIADWMSRAEAAFQRAATLDPTFATPQLYLLQLAALRGDTGAVGRAAASYVSVDSGGDFVSFVRWRAETLRGDHNTTRIVRQRQESASTASLRAIILSSLYNALPPAEAERALETLRARVTRGRDRTEALVARHALALNQGDLATVNEELDALETARSRQLSYRLRILDALYADGDSIRAVRAFAQLARRIAPLEHDSLRGVSADTSSAADVCVAGQWRAWHGDSVGATRDAALLRPAAGGAEGTWNSLCATLIDAASALSLRLATAPALANQLDSLLLAGVSDEEGRTYAALAASRVFGRLGEPRRALAAVRRRPYMREWPHYLAAHWKAEGAFAAQVADTVGARAAYRSYLDLRRSPKIAETDVQSALAALGGQ